MQWLGDVNPALARYADAFRYCMPCGSALVVPADLLYLGLHVARVCSTVGIDGDMLQELDDSALSQEVAAVLPHHTS